MGTFPNDLFEFAWMAHSDTSFDDYIQELADKAQKEDWGSDNKILRNYLSFTYKYLSEAANDDIRKNGQTSYILTNSKCAIFNTGLFDQYYEAIYAYFKRNKNTSVSNPKPWFFIGFKSAGDYELSMFSTLPTRMNYFEEADQLVFDPRLQIRTNVQHILGDNQNIQRLPTRFQAYSKTSLSMILNGSIDNSKKMAASNYTVAVPQFFHSQLQLLLPITLPGSVNPDLALTITKGNGFYSGNTCLTMGMAYNNARLITKPSSSWLHI